jgi:sodium pump decarboxylase gamma subunit
MLFNLLKDVRKVEVGDAALYALIGFLVVFLGIAFLVFVVWLVGKILSSVTAKSDDKKTKAAVLEKTVQPTNLMAENNENEIPDETIAVIMAALTAYYQKNQPKCEFTVKRIKRI